MSKLNSNNLSLLITKEQLFNIVREKAVISLERIQNLIELTAVEDLPF